MRTVAVVVIHLGYSTCCLFFVCKGTAIATVKVTPKVIVVRVVCAKR